jgi:hypothetical protein
MSSQSLTACNETMAAAVAFDALLSVHIEAPDFGNSSRRQERNPLQKAPQIKKQKPMAKTAPKPAAENAPQTADYQ